MLRAPAVVLVRVDEALHLARHPALFVELLVADDLPHQAFLVVLVEDLEGLGQAAGSALRETLAGDPPLEPRLRLKELLARTAVPGPGEELRGVRAVAALERTATPAARRLLQRLATGAPEARLTAEAKASFGRFAQRLSVHELRVPVSKVASSVTRSVHVPLAC